MSNNNRKLTGIGCAFFFLLPFAVVGIGMASALGIQVWEWNSARSWVERPCWIERTELKVERDETVSYQARADYRYEFNNREFKNSRVSFDSGFDSVGDFQRRVHRELEGHHQERRPFRCFVNPNNPNESVLYRDLRPEMLIFNLGFVFAFGGVGVGGLVALAFAARKARRMDAVRVQHPHEPWIWDSAIADGLLLPKPRWLEFTVFAFLANSIAWPVAMFFLWDGFRQEPWLLWLVGLFPLTGLYLAWKAIRETRRRIRFGRPTLSIARWPYYVGDELTGTIEFPRDRPVSEELVIELSVYEKGSGDESDKERFKETIRVPNAGERCSFRFAPPAGLPRTELLNETANDKTAKWELTITGSEGAADFQVSYDLVVFVRDVCA